MTSPPASIGVVPKKRPAAAYQGRGNVGKVLCIGIALQYRVCRSVASVFLHLVIVYFFDLIYGCMGVGAVVTAREGGCVEFVFSAQMLPLPSCNESLHHTASGVTLLTDNIIFLPRTRP